MRTAYHLAIPPIVGALGCTEADGGFFLVKESSTTAESADQRAVIIHDESRETIILQTAYAGRAADFAWIIPTPTKVTQQHIQEGPEGLFDALYEATEPYAYVEEEGGVACGCGGGGDLTGPEYAGVEVWDEFEIADYQVSILSADDSANLDGWLDDNGYRTPDGTPEILDHYVQKDWYFVALKMAPGGSARSDGYVTPIQLTFESSQAVFPMRISALSTQGEISVLLYVFADHRVRGENCGTIQIDVADSWPGGGDFAAYYEQRFRNALARMAPFGLVVEYADHTMGYDWANMLPLAPEEHYFLTRLRTYLTPAQMDDDIVLTQADTDETFSVRLASATPRSANRYAWLAFGAFALVGALLGGYRPRRGAHRWLLAITWAALILFA